MSCDFPIICPSLSYCRLILYYYYILTLILPKSVHTFILWHLRKNLSLYLPIGAWLMITLVALVYNEFEWPKYWSQEPPLIVDSLRRFDLSLRSSRKFLLLWSNTWKNILHYERMELQSYFLQKSQDDSYRKLDDNLKLLVSLSTKKCSDQFHLLEQSQNSMWLLIFFLKNSLSSLEIAAEWIWYECNNESKILLVACNKSVIMIIQLILEIPTAWLIPHLIVKSLASVVETLTA